MSSVGGFTIRFDYPVIESINSLLPYVDKYVINVGISDDGTLELIQSNFGDNKNVKISSYEWEQKEHGTTFFSSQTNNALAELDTDWAMYLQADEVLNSEDAKKVRNWVDRAEREGLLGVTCNYLHFEKDYNHLRKSYKNGGDAYDKEVRIVKNNLGVISFGDAQGFCTVEDYFDHRGPQTIMHRPELLADSTINIYHYGYIKNPKVMLDKKKYLAEFYDISEPGRKEKIPEVDGGYKYSDDLIEFTGKHPEVMENRIGKFNSTRE